MAVETPPATTGSASKACRWSSKRPGDTTGSYQASPIDPDRVHPLTREGPRVVFIKGPPSTGRRTQVTRHKVRWRCFLEFRLLGSAAIKNIRATGMKTAPLRWRNRTGHITRKNEALSIHGGIRNRNRGE